MFDVLQGIHFELSNILNFDLFHPRRWWNIGISLWRLSQVFNHANLIRVTCIDRDRGLFYAAAHGGFVVTNLLLGKYKADALIKDAWRHSFL